MAVLDMVIDGLMQSGRAALLASGPITYPGVGDKKSVVTQGGL